MARQERSELEISSSFPISLCISLVLFSLSSDSFVVVSVIGILVVSWVLRDTVTFLVVVVLLVCLGRLLVQIESGVIFFFGLIVSGGCVLSLVCVGCCLRPLEKS